jgi:hypothetical protein
MTIIYAVLSLSGSLASIVGIPLALFQVGQAKNAARKSEEEARASKEASLQTKVEVEKFRNELRLISNIVDLEKALSLMDDIKAFIRTSTFGPVPDKIASLIVILNTVRSPSTKLREEAVSKIQAAVAALRRIEDEIHRSSLSQVPPKGVLDFNRIISRHIDVLQPILIELRNRISEKE